MIYAIENNGVSNARNFGSEKASGKYIMFLDADDWIELDICEECIKIVDKKNVDVIMWPYIREYKTRSLKKKVFDKDIIFEGEKLDALHRRYFYFSNITTLSRGAPCGTHRTITFAACMWTKKTDGSVIITAIHIGIIHRTNKLSLHVNSFRWNFCASPIQRNDCLTMKFMINTGIQIRFIVTGVHHIILWCKSIFVIIHHLLNQRLSNIHICNVCRCDDIGDWKTTVSINQCMHFPSKPFDEVAVGIQLSTPIRKTRIIRWNLRFWNRMLVSGKLTCINRNIGAVDETKLSGLRTHSSEGFL